MSGRVLLLGPIPPPLGGMATYTEGYLRSEVVRAFEVRHLPNDLIPKQAYVGLRRRVLNVANSAALVTNLIWILLAHRPHIAHVLTSSFGGFFEKALLGLLCRLFRCRVVMHVHGGQFGEFYAGSSAPVRWLIRHLLRRYQRVAVLSEQMRRVFLGIGARPERLVILGNAVETPARSIWDQPECATGSGPPSGAPLTVLFLNRVTRAKGVFELVEAAARVSTARPHVRFRIVGPESSDSAELARHIAMAGLGDRVELAPAVEGEAKAAAYLGADVYVLPSHVEGLPGGLLEAMAYGLPCITTPVGGIPSILTDGQNGLLVPVGDPAGLAEAIQRLVRDADLRRRLGTAARATIVGRFDWATRVGEIARLYRELLGESSRSPAAA